MNEVTLLEKKETAKGTFNLINGSFTPAEGREILMHLINKKINFHEIRDFSYKIRFEEGNEESQQRIVELKQSKKEIETLIKAAKESGKDLKISSSINIELV